MSELGTPRVHSAGRAWLSEISFGWQIVLLGALLLLYIFQAVSATTQESNTFDEPVHLTTGYLYWTHPETKLWPQNGISAQAWAALPLLFDHLSVTQRTESQLEDMSEWDQGYRFFYLMGNDPDQMLFQARVMISLLGAGLGTLVFFWSRQLFGTSAGFISLFLFIFCPTMLAHGALVTSDMATTLGFFAATLCFWRLTHVVSAPRLLLSILALAFLALGKMSSILIAPTFLFILLVRCVSARPIELNLGWKRKIEKRWSKTGVGILLLLMQLVAVIGLLWFSYNFKYLDSGEAEARRQILDAPDFTLLSGNGMKASCLETLDKIHLVPPAYLEGLSYQLLTRFKGAFLCGSYYQNHWFYFLLVAFLIKTPISTLILFLLSFAVYGRWRWVPREEVLSLGKTIRSPGLYDLAPLLILGGVYTLGCLSGGLNGHRYLMPIYPVLFVLAGANVFWLRYSQPIFRVGLAILLVGVMVESLSVRPHYLAFFNQFIGGPRYGYHYLVDSSLDWGQDLPGLRQWLEKKAPESGDAKIYLSYFGSSDPEYYGIQSLRLPDRFSPGPPEPFPWAGGIYCISATQLQGDRWSSSLESLYQQEKKEKARWDATATDPAARDSLIKDEGANYWGSCLVADRQFKFFRLCSYLRQQEPDDEVGYSILIYRLSDENIKQALEGPLKEL